MIVPEFRVLLPADADVWRVPVPPSILDGSPEYLERQYGSLVREPAVGCLTSEPLVQLTNAYKHWQGAEPPARVPKHAAYAAGTIVEVTELPDFCMFSGKFSACKVDGKLLLEVVLNTLALHGSFKKPGHNKPLIASQTVEKIVTNARTGQSWRARAEELEAFLSRVLGEDSGGGHPSPAERRHVIAEADAEIGALMKKLEGDSESTDFQQARQLLVAVTCIVVRADPRARAVEADEDDDDEDAEDDEDDTRSILSELTNIDDNILRLQASEKDSDSSDGDSSDDVDSDGNTTDNDDDTLV
jgi:hypothetical protein